MSRSCMISHIAHVAEWDPYNGNDLAHVSEVGSVLYADPAQPSHNGK